MSSRLQSLYEVLALIAVPAVLIVCAVFRIQQAAGLTLLVAVVAIGIFFVGWERSKPGLRQIMPTVVLAALAAAGRMLFAVVPSVKPVTSVSIVAGAVFGKRCGFMVGALAALVSNFFFGQGPWTPWQMYAWGLVGYIAGILASHHILESKVAIYLYGFFAAFIYALCLNTWTLVGFVQPFTWHSFALAYGAALPLDLIHAVSNVAFLFLIYAPWKRKLQRVKSKYDL